jgi:NADH dehydrogenase
MDRARQEDVDWIVGDVTNPRTYADRLAGCDAVVHLAAITGKARRDDYFRVNVAGTRAAVDACRAAGVRRFLYVSTIAAGFADQRHYYYAHSKRQAEEIVAASGLAYTIVRPTIVIGPGAPVLAGFTKMAGAPVVPIFGNGRATVQPIFVDDLADCLAAILEEDRFGGETIEVGGPEVTSIEKLLMRIRRVRFDKGPRSIHIPLGLARIALAILEPAARKLLPLTAGQLATFANDGVAAPHPLVDARRERMKTVDEVLSMSALDV